ncbi:MAG: hypothetical protein ACYTX0_09370, partial [Nostoc sp.]
SKPARYLFIGTLPRTVLSLSKRFKDKRRRTEKLRGALSLGIRLASALSEPLREHGMSCPVPTSGYEQHEPKQQYHALNC